MLFFEGTDYYNINFTCMYNFYNTKQKLVTKHVQNSLSKQEGAKKTSHLNCIYNECPKTDFLLV